jgi:hypothetical protein
VGVAQNRTGIIHPIETAARKFTAMLRAAHHIAVVAVNQVHRGVGGIDLNYLIRINSSDDEISPGLRPPQES